MSRGLHLLGANPDFDPMDVKTPSQSGGKGAPAPGNKTDYTPYIQAAGSVAEGITSALAKSGQPAPAPPPPPPPESNTVWYVGGAAALAVVIALLLRSRA